jgi:glycosyltransferase involved in cell wall biosynthesis
MLPELVLAADELELVALAPIDANFPAGSERVERVDIEPRPAIVWEQLRLARTARRLGLSLVHTVTDRLPMYRPPRTVVYLFEDPRHRVALARPESGARQRISDGLTNSLFPGTLRRAELILTSSDATRRDVIDRGADESIVRVVHPGVNRAFCPGGAEEIRAIRESLGLTKGYVLHFSSDDLRDNSRVALEAFAAVAERFPDVPPLVVAGSVSALLPEQQLLARELGILDCVRWVGHQTGERLTSLYRAASAYVDPSLYEGFGFQVAEALASGLPVVCSNTTSLPEVVGEAGILVAPTDVRGFADGLRSVLQDGALAAGLRERAAQQAAQFQWSKTAQETVAAWREVLAG